MNSVEVVWARADGNPDQADELLRREIGLTHRIRTQISRLCPACGSDRHGRPVVADPGLHVSLSRCQELIVIGFTTSGAVGVDVERADAPTFAGFEGVVTWTRKESLLKATGDGLRVDPASIGLSGPDEQPAILDWPARPATVWMRDFIVGDDHVGAVTVLGNPEAFSVREAQAAPAD